MDINYNDNENYIEFLNNNYSEEEIVNILEKFYQKDKQKEISQYNNIQYVGWGRYKYNYKTSDGKTGSIIGDSISDLEFKARRSRIPWNP